jgi:hypothetical protein
MPPPKAQTPMNAQVSTRKVLLILNSRLESRHMWRTEGANTKLGLV